MKTTTLREILKHKPCKDGFKKLLEGLNYPTRRNLLTKKMLGAELPTRFILENNGIQDTVWALCVFVSTPDWYRFKADVAELALPIFEKKYPLDKRPRLAIQAARDFAEGKISREELDGAYANVTLVADAAYFTSWCTHIDADRACSEVVEAAQMADCYEASTAYYLATCVYVARVYAARACIIEGCVVDQTWEEITKILLKYI